MALETMVTFISTKLSKLIIIIHISGFCEYSAELFGFTLISQLFANGPAEQRCDIIKPCA